MLRKTITVIAASGLLVSGMAMSASAAPVEEEFWVDALTLDNPVFQNSVDVSGDDAGFVALSGNTLLATGNAGGNTDNISVGVYSDLSTLTPVSPQISPLTDRQGSFLFTNLETQTAHIFTYEFNGGDHSEKYVTLVGFKTVGPDGIITSNPEIRLSQSIVADNRLPSPGSCMLMGSGYGRVGLWDGCQGKVWDINLTDGSVVEYSGQRLFSDFPNRVINVQEASNEWRGAGILEYRDGVLSFLQTGTTDGVRTGIYRFTPSTGAQDLVLPFATPVGNGVDLDDFVYSTQTGQWCGHQEGSDGRNLIPEMDGMSEVVFCFSATSSLDMSVPPTIPTTEPELANTGFDFAQLTAVGGVSVFLLGLGVVVISLRRIRS